MQNQICLITGATDGVGKATAIELARLGFTVVMVARNKAKAEAVRAEIMASTGNSNVDYLIADLCSLTQIREVAKSFKRRYPWLDVLINNAGIFLSVRKTTEDGYEMNFQVNYLSHFLLTTLLLDELKKSGQGRVVNLASSVYRLGEFDPYNLQSERKFSTMGTYSSSKLFVVMSTVELARAMSGTTVTANAVHPGIVRTHMMLSAPGMWKVISYSAFPFSISPEKGAATSVYLASSEEVRQMSGRYFAYSKPEEIKTRFNTDEARELLWNMSACLANL